MRRSSGHDAPPFRRLLVLNFVLILVPRGSLGDVSIASINTCVRSTKHPADVTPGRDPTPADRDHGT